MCGLVTLTPLLPCSSSFARRIRTTNTPAKGAVKSNGNRNAPLTRNNDVSSDNQLSTAVITVTGEELLPYRDLIAMSGYDKAASSSRESICITNNSEMALQSLSLEITYLDMQERMLHKRVSEINLNIPPGETRTATFNHYDPQKTLYYYRSKPPRKYGIPYKVSLSLTSLSLIGD